MGIVITPDDHIEVVEPWNGHDYQLEEIKHHIGGGYIEIVNIGDSYQMVVDEDGIRKELPINGLATAVYLAGGGQSSIYGTALIVKKGEIE